MPEGCGSVRFIMLTYFVYAPLLNRIDALPSNIRWGFETTSNLDKPCKLKVIKGMK